MTDNADFLDRVGWGNAEMTPLPSDASDRSYCRLRRPDGSSAVLMSAPVVTSAKAASQFAEFRRVGQWLRARGLGAPQEIAADGDTGLLLLEDLGELSLSKLLDQGDEVARDAYSMTVAVLSTLATVPLPDWLLRPDARTMAEMVDLTFSLVPGSEALAEATVGILVEEIEKLEDALVLSLRDVHGDNLIWRPHAKGLSRIGLLDFQDAVAFPDGYDLASLLDDPRRVVPRDWRDDLVRDYAVARGLSHDAMAYRVDLLSLQRNLRILGVFRRLSTALERPAYARFLPRTRALVWRSVGHPRLHRMRPVVRELLDRTASWEAAAA